MRAGGEGCLLVVDRVVGAARWRAGVDLDLGELVGQKFGRGGLAHPQHEQVVEVADDLTGLRAGADLGLDVAHGLGVGRHLHTRAARFVDHGDELVANQLVELVGMQVDADLAAGE